MSEHVSTALEARGPLAEIADPVARKEIGKLWNVIEGNAPVAGKPSTRDTWVRRADLTATEQALSRRIEEISKQGTRAAPTSGASTVSSGGLDLRPLDNVWTGLNTFQSVQARATRLHCLQAGPLFLAAPTVLLPAEFTAALDIQKTSDVSTATQLGGSAALYVQHRAGGNQPPGGAVLTSAIRAQMETRQTGVGPANDSVAGYFTIANLGVDVGGFGLHVDAYHHAGGDGPVTFGVDVEMLGSTYSQTGKQVGYMLRSWGQGDYTRRTDYGFLASPETAGSAARIEFPFSVGSSWIGDLDCAIAFDAGHARVTLAGMRLATSAPIVFDGPSVNACTLRYTGAALQVQNAGLPVFSIQPSGNVTIHSGRLSFPGITTRAPAPSLTPGVGAPNLRHFGYFPMALGGFTRWIPFFGE